MQAFQVVCLSATYYVDGTQGSDNNGGLSASDAWRTIQGAADRVTAGDTCIVLPGAYRERVRVGTSGRSGSPIVFEADGAVVTGGFTIQANYVHVRGFEITDTVDDYRDGTGIYVAGQYCVLEDNYIHDVTWEGINLYAGGDYDSTSTSHCTVRGNRIQRAGHAGMLIHGRDHLIEDNDISHSLQYPDGWSQSWADADGLIFFGSGHVIRGNHIHDIHQTAPENQGDPHIDAVQTWGPAYNIIFEKNRFEIPDYPEYSRIMQIAMIEELVSPVRDLTFRNNIFTNTGRGPNVWSCEGMVFVNNVLVNIRQYGIELHDSDNSVVENNIFYNVGDHSRAYVWSDSSADIGYNLHFMSDGGSPAGSPFPQDLWQRDPQFSDLSQGDFRLRASSPCIDSGVNVGVTADFAGNPVPQGDGPDIGAYEYAVVSSETYRLVVNASHGTVSQSPAQASYAQGETVTLSVVPEAGYSFVGWSGDLSGSANPATVTMNADKSITADFTEVAPATYTLNTSGANGSVAKAPDKTSYDEGETVTLAATPNTGYSFASWSGDLSGSSPSTTLTMDGNKSVTANFTANTYTLAAGGANGSVARAPDKSSYAHGETVTLTATANTGYSFATWSGDASGTSPSTTLTMDGDKFVTANFAINTYTLTVNGTNGSVTSTPEKASYTYGETVTVQAVADSGYEFTGWSGDLSGGTNPVTVTMDANKSVTAGFAAERADTTPPVAAASSPEADAVQVPLNSLVTLNISDDGEGVDANTVTISIDGTTVYSGSVSSYESAGGICRRTGTKNDYAYAYQSDADFDFSDTITIRANAADLNGNVMNQYVYSFETEMWAFGTDRAVSADVASGDKGRPVTASDNSGNLWVAWHAGAAGQRDVYLSKRGSGESNFADPIQLTSDAGDQANADLAIGADNRLYIVWQDNRRGNWDVYFRTSSDGANWSAETRITDSDDNQIVPVVAVDGTSRCHVAWQDDRDGHQDIYVAGSGDRFASATVARVTSHASDQTDPDIAVDASGGVYLLWTDARNGSDDIYGAASNSNSWANVAVVTGAGDQYAPALAAEDEGTRLHLAWTDDATGNSDVCYASADGMPVGPLAGVSVVDDTSGADQLAPALATAGSTGDGLRVFVCWQDWRNVTATGRDIDLYFVEVKETDETNVLVGDGGAGSDQSEPAVGVDSRGFPYVVWTDHRNAYAEIYYAGTMSRDSEVLHAQDVTASEGGTVGTISPSGVGDVSVVIPPAASSQDVTVTVREIENPAAAPASGGILSYEFGPSGLAFRRPVTMTIPYRTSEFGGVAPTPLWYDSQTGGLSQQGITDVERVTLAFGIEAIRFKTTHFTPYYLVSDSGMDEVVAGGSGGGGGGGGCSLSSAHDSPDPIAYFIPYMLIAAIVGALRLKDAKRRT